MGRKMSEKSSESRGSQVFRRQACRTCGGSWVREVRGGEPESRRHHCRAARVPRRNVFCARINARILCTDSSHGFVTVRASSKWQGCGGGKKISRLPRLRWSLGPPTDRYGGTAPSRSLSRMPSLSGRHRQTCGFQHGLPLTMSVLWGSLPCLITNEQLKTAVENWV